MTSIFIVGPDYSEPEVAGLASSSPAAAAWVRDFIGLIERFHPIAASIWFSTESAWPRGRFFVPSERLQTGSRRRALVAYWNLPSVKSLLASRGLRFELSSQVSPNDIVIVYGQRTIMPRDLKRISGMVKRLILIIPDAPIGRAGEVQIRLAAQYATGGVICLPAELDNALTGFRRLSFQGVVGPALQTKNLSACAGSKFVFVGGVDRFSGTHFLLEALERNGIGDCKYVVMGRINDHATANRLSDLGVEVTGFVDESRMMAECSEAFAFLNPRDPRMDVSSRNFPSKLLLYMRYQRPIISTDTKGLPRELAAALECEGVDSPDAFARQIELLRQSDTSSIKERTDKLQAYVASNLSEKAVLNKLENFLMA